MDEHKDRWLNFAQFHEMLAPSVMNAQVMCDSFMRAKRAGLEARMPERLRVEFLRQTAVANNFLHVLCIAIDGGLISREEILAVASREQRVEEMEEIEKILDVHMDCWLEMKAKIPAQNSAVCPACRRAK